MDWCEASIKREKEAGRDLRRSRWWQNMIQKSTCFYCKKDLNTQTATMDHILPLSQGGRSTKGNVVPCCKTCNTLKAAMAPWEWDAYLKRP